MAQCEEQVFKGVGPEHVTKFLQKGAEFGIGGLENAGNSGEASHSGFSLRWHFEPEHGTLAVQCTQSPMFVPCGLINGKIRQAIDAVLAEGSRAEA